MSEKNKNSKNGKTVKTEKSNRGRKAGTFSFQLTTLGELNRYFKDEMQIPVSVAWIKSLHAPAKGTIASTAEVIEKGVELKVHSLTPADSTPAAATPEATPAQELATV